MVDLAVAETHCLALPNQTQSSADFRFILAKMPFSHAKQEGESGAWLQGLHRPNYYNIRFASFLDSQK